MSYTPTVWQTGDIVSSTKLNKLENAVKDLADELDEGVPYDDSESYEDGTLGRAVSDLKSAIGDGGEKILAAFPTDSMSGALVNFQDGADSIPVKALTVSIQPVQGGSGDPAPDNVRPISGWTEANVTRTGKNWFDFTSYADWSDGYLKTNGVPSGTSAVAPAYERCSPYVPIKGGQAYTMSYRFTGEIPAGGSGSNNICFYDANKTMVGTRIAAMGQTYITGTAPSNAAYLRFSHRTYGMSVDYILAMSATEQPYEPYSGTTLTIDLDGTIYGGTLDVLTGVLTARPYYASYNGETLVGPWVSSMDKYAAGATPTTGAQVVDLGGTPTVVQLDPEALSTLLGANNIWADAGDVSVVYRADPTLYIRKLTGPAESDMVADASIASGQYFMVGNRLFLATAAIAAGAALTVGTNCTETNLAAALNAINS